MNAVSTLSVKECIQMTQIGERTIRDAVHSGKLPAIKLGQRRIRIRPQALEAWLKDLEQGGAK